MDHQVSVIHWTLLPATVTDDPRRPIQPPRQYAVASDSTHRTRILSASTMMADGPSITVTPRGEISIAPVRSNMDAITAALHRHRQCARSHEPAASPSCSPASRRDDQERSNFLLMNWTFFVDFQM